jgi:hypothetical protein
LSAVIPPQASGYQVFVSNEKSGDPTVISGVDFKVSAAVRTSASVFEKAPVWESSGGNLLPASSGMAKYALDSGRVFRPQAADVSAAAAGNSQMAKPSSSAAITH